jgi:hypothetical protein
LQYLNAETEIVVTEDGIEKWPVSPLGYATRLLPEAENRGPVPFLNPVLPVATVNEVSELQPANDSDPLALQVAGILILVTPPAKRKAPAAIAVTDEGTT